MHSAVQASITSTAGRSTSAPELTTWPAASSVSGDDASAGGTTTPMSFRAAVTYPDQLMATTEAANSHSSIRLQPMTPAMPSPMVAYEYE